MYVVRVFELSWGFGMVRDAMLMHGGVDKEPKMECELLYLLFLYGIL